MTICQYFAHFGQHILCISYDSRISQVLLSMFTARWVWKTETAHIVSLAIEGVLVLLEKQNKILQPTVFT